MAGRVKKLQISEGVSITSPTDLTVGGSGQGEINYITQGDGEAGVTDWNTYQDAAGVTPVDGTGDAGTKSIAAATTTDTAGQVLRGDNSIKLVKGAVNEQGEGWSYDFTIDPADENKLMKVYFDYKFSSSNYDGSTEKLTVYIYDVGGSTLITPNNTDIVASTADGASFEASWLSTTSNTYRLIFHVAGTGTSAWDAYVDNIIVGPGRTYSGAVVGSWVDLDKTTCDALRGWTGGTTTSHVGRYRRVGEDMECEIYLDAATVGSSGNLIWTVPAGLTIDTSKLKGVGMTSTDVVIGHGVHRDSSESRNGPVWVAYESSTSVMLYRGTYTATTYTHVLNTGMGYDLTDSGDEIFFRYKVPIAEWAGSGTMNVLQEDNLSGWTAFTPAYGNLTEGDGTNLGFYRRVGSNMEIMTRFTFGSTSAVSGSVTLTIPDSKTLDNSAFPSPTAIEDFGVGTAEENGGTSYGLTVRYATSTSVTIAVKRADTTYQQFAALSSTVPFIWGTSDTLWSKFSVPISEWANVNQNSLVGYSEASTTQAGLVSTGTQTLGGAKTFNDELFVGSATALAQTPFQVTKTRTDNNDHIARFIYNSSLNGSGQVGVYVETGDASPNSFRYLQFAFGGDEDTVGTQAGYVGNLGDTAAVSYATSSDERLKENYKESKFGIDTVMAMNPVTFKWKKTGAEDNGFLAQEIHKVYPYVVGVGGDDPEKDPWAMDYGKLTPVLVKAIQDQQKQIDALKEQIKKLTAR